MSFNVGNAVQGELENISYEHLAGIDLEFGSGTDGLDDIEKIDSFDNLEDGGKQGGFGGDQGGFGGS